jgi:hypothetical protein
MGETTMKSFLPILALVFITLKLTGTISWSWWLVLLPLYGGLAALLILIVFMVLMGSSVKAWRS